MVIEANIDDMTPQNFAYVTERLLEAGALDVCTIPVQMKKGRSGFILQVLSPMNRCDVLSRLIFQETTSIGLRQFAAKRSALERKMVPVETRHGRVMIKVSMQDGKVVSSSTGIRRLRRIAREKNVPLKEVQLWRLRPILSGNIEGREFINVQFSIPNSHPSGRRLLFPSSSDG